MKTRRRVAAAAAIASLVAGLALLPPADARRDPRWNVVVIVTDDQTFDSIPHDPPVMPYLQAAATDPGDHWVVFPNAFANTPLCCPSRATLLTGRYAHEHGVLTNRDGHLLDESTTIASVLDGAGYHTGFVGKYLNHYPFGPSESVPAGWDHWSARVHGEISTLYYDYTLIQEGLSVPYGHAAGDYATDVLADRAVGFVRGAPAGRPFLLWFAPTAPHIPWAPAPRHEGAFADLALDRPPSFDEAMVGDKPAWVRELPRLDRAVRADVQEARRGSFEALLAVDEAVAAIVGALEARGDLDRTLIVYVSDNGFSFGEHRWFRKTCPYDPCTRIPFLVRYPPAEHRVEPAPVSAVDLAPTIADLVGVETIVPMDGSSVLTLIAEGDDAGLSRRVFSESAGDGRIPGWSQVRTVRFAYIELLTGERELYDLRGDPDQLMNRADDPSHADVIARLAAALRRFRGS